MKKNSYLISIVAFVSCCHLVSIASAKDKVIKSKYKVGQVWSYKTRPSEKASTFIVLKIENDGKYDDNDNIIHVAVRDLKLKNRQNATVINFLPVYERALKRSMPKLLKQNVETLAFQKEYASWRKVRDEGVGGGVYTVPLAECVALHDEP